MDDIKRSVLFPARPWGVGFPGDQSAVGKRSAAGRKHPFPKSDRPHPASVAAAHPGLRRVGGRDSAVTGASAPFVDTRRGLVRRVDVVFVHADLAVERRQRAARRPLDAVAVTPDRSVRAHSGVRRTMVVADTRTAALGLGLEADLDLRQAVLGCHDSLRGHRPDLFQQQFSQHLQPPSS